MLSRPCILCYNKHGFIPWSQSTRLSREGALGPLSLFMKDSIQSKPRTINRIRKQSTWLSYNRKIFADWKWIFSYSKRFKGPIAAFTVLGLISCTLGLISSIAGKFLVDVVIGHKADQLGLAALVMFGGFQVGIFISPLKSV